LPQSFKKNIALTGFMAAGKSVVGKRLARRLKRRFVDLDQAIEAREGMSVAAIFGRKGEPYFRGLEKRLLRELLERNEQVIATGGGAVLDEDNVRLLKRRAVLVCLTAQPETLLKRSGGGKERPLLQGEDRRRRIAALLRQRETSYAKADYSVDTDELSVDEVVEKIVEALKIAEGKMHNAESS
jgi:shikimate kinase